MEIKKIKEFLQERIGKEIEFEDNDNIFKLGLVNSLFALELVNFLESTFSISIENDDLNLSNFNSLINLELFVTRKTAEKVN